MDRCMRLIAPIHTEKSFRNLIKSNRNQIVFTIFWLIWNQTDVRLVPNQSENDNYNLISVWLNKILKIFLRVQNRLGIANISAWHTKLRRTVVSDSVASWHPGGLIECLPKTLQTSQQITPYSCQRQHHGGMIECLPKTLWTSQTIGAEMLKGGPLLGSHYIEWKFSSLAKIFFLQRFFLHIFRFFFAVCFAHCKTIFVPEKEML